MISAGETILHFDVENHLYIVLTPEMTDHTVALVNLTSHGRPKYTDHRRCFVVRADEHPWLRHDSCINYRRAVVNPIAPLIKAKNEGTLSQDAPCTPDLLRRIQEGALSSRETPRDVREAVSTTLAADA